MINKTQDIYKKLKINNKYKLTEEEKITVNLLDTTLSNEGRFKLYQQVYDKSYKTKTEENTARINLNKSLIKINKENNSNLTYKLGFTQFSDLSQEQYSDYYGILILDNTLDDTKDTLPTNIDDKKLQANEDVSKFLIDYAARGQMTPIQNQLGCGACWAFSAIAAFEGKVAKDKNLKGTTKIPKYSEQQLTSCVPYYGKAGGTIMGGGCNGGMPKTAFDFLKKTDAVLLKDYKYVSGSTKKTETCKTNIKAKKTAKVVKHHSIGSPNKPDEYAMASSLFNNGPLSIGIAVSQTETPEFFQYKSGIYTGKSAQKLSHAVVIVGLVKAQDVPGVGSNTKDIKYAWKIRNSWGTGAKGWGYNGHVYFPYGKNQNQCANMPEAIDQINVDIPAGPKPGPAPGPGPKPSPTPKPCPKPSPTPKPGPIPSPTSKPGPKPSPTPKPGPIDEDYKKYYSNPNDGECLAHKLTFENDMYSVCTIKAEPQPGTIGLASDIKLSEYCPGINEKPNIRPLFFVQGTTNDKYCAVACNNNADCFNGAICKQVMHQESSLQVCVFEK